MFRSLKRSDPSAVMWVLCLSEECHRALAEIDEPSVKMLQIEDLEKQFPALSEARSNRSLIEFYFTCTPSLVRYVLREVPDQDTVTYVDGDLYFFSDPSPLFEELGRNSVSIIPHRFPPELRHLEKFGLYNVGWMSFRNDVRGHAVVEWWQDRCNEWCYDVLDGDRFADQKFLDRIATEFDGVVLLTHRGANLAPWNVGGHQLTFEEGRVLVDRNWPLIFFHFHGLRQAGKRIYIPGHFRYRAPFGRLIRTKLYRPYIQNLERIREETSGYIRGPASLLSRSVSERVGTSERIIGLLKKPVKDALAIIRGEFLVVRRRKVLWGTDKTGAEAEPAIRKLRILIVHNYYGSSGVSGENSVVGTEIDMLRRAGHDVHTFIRSSDEIRDKGWRGLLHGGMAVTWNIFEVLRLKKVMRQTEPDIVHAHNTFPLISAAIFWFMPRHSASVLTLHNYRIFCANALLLRDGAVCTRCLDEASVFPALRYGCYRGSRAATLPLALSIALHRAIGTWQSKVDAFIAVTEFQRRTMAAAGLPMGRMHVKPNFFSGSPVIVPWHERNDLALFVGRLFPDKGVEYLIRAWLELGAGAPHLRIIGDGPLRASLEELVRSRGADNIEFMGRIPPEAATREVSLAKLLIVPSIWFEGFPIVLQDAFASGTPSAVSNIGSLPTIVDDGINGFVFAARDAGAIASLINRVWGDALLLKSLSVGARSSFEKSYTEKINYDHLMKIYAAAIARRQQTVR